MCVYLRKGCGGITLQKVLFFNQMYTLAASSMCAIVLKVSMCMWMCAYVCVCVCVAVCMCVCVCVHVRACVFIILLSDQLLELALL